MRKINKQEAPYSVGTLARRFHLSRSTLLYYDRIGLLRPSLRSRAAYRQYSEPDVQRLAQICKFRQTGLSLLCIKRVLDAAEDDLTPVLVKRMEELSTEIERLRAQQRFIIGILKTDDYSQHLGVMNTELWQTLTRAAGFSDEDALRWHAEFERHSPAKHHKFLEFMCIPEEQITRIRARARQHPRAGQDGAAGSTWA